MLKITADPFYNTLGGVKIKVTKMLLCVTWEAPYLPYMERPDAMPEMAKESVERRSPVSTAIPKMV